MNQEHNLSEETAVTDPELEAIETELYDLQTDVDRWIVRSEGYQLKNVMHFFQHKKQWMRILHEAAGKVSALRPENQRQGANYLAAAYYHLGTACSWTEMWHYSYVLLREGLPFAKKAGNEEALSKYREEMNYYARGPRMTEEIKACRTVAELDALLAEDDDIGGTAPRNTSSETHRDKVTAVHQDTGVARPKNRGGLHEEKSGNHGCLWIIVGVVIFIVMMGIL